MPNSKKPSPKSSKNKSRKYVLYCDGFFGSKKKPRPGCSVAYNPKYAVEKFYADGFDIQTTNEAEYFALWQALMKVNFLRWESPDAVFIVYSDSMLIVNQYLGRWECTLRRLRYWRDLCRASVRVDTDVRVLWISRKASVRILGH